MKYNDHSKPSDPILLSGYIDGEVDTAEKEAVESWVRESEPISNELAALKGVSSQIQTAYRLQLTEQDRSRFDRELMRRIEASRQEEGWIYRLFAQPFRSYMRLSWQWQAAMALLLMLLVYLPFMPGSTKNLDTPIFNTDLNGNIKIESEQNVGYDFILLTTEDDKEDEIGAPYQMYHHT